MVHFQYVQIFKIQFKRKLNCKYYIIYRNFYKKKKYKYILLWNLTFYTDLLHLDTICKKKTYCS